MESRHKIWLIPALIIGFNCIAFIVILAVSLNKDRNTTPGEPVSAVSENESIETPDDNEDGEPKAQLSESFYDEEVPDLKEQGSGYILLLTSSESDLKIQMVDENGAAPAGMSWTARITGGNGDEFEAEDDDGDGIIYLGEMAPGDYTVVMDNGSGIVETSTIAVKPKIRYKASSGIRSIVLQESDIDAKVEDTAADPAQKESEAEQEGEGTSSTEGISLPQGTLGIDVSKYNKDIDWQRVRASGIEFAIIRVGYRGSSSGVLVEDPYFRQNLAGAKAAGVNIGVYFFTQAITADEAREEAEAVASLVNASDLSLPVFLDVESSGNSNGGRADGLDPVTRTEIVRVFCESAENLGYRAGVYANKTWMTKKLDMSVLAPYTKWLAQYRASGPTYDGDYSIWQYTSSGTVDGITGRVDLDIFLK